MNQLAEYIKAQLDKGYASLQIKQYLLQHGYKEKDIDDALNEIKNNNFSNPSVTNNAQINNQNASNNYSSNELLKTQLTSYVFTYLQKGYQPDQIYTTLSTQGYDKNLLREIFLSIDKKYYNGNMQSSILHEHSLSNSSLMKFGALVIVLFLIVGGGIFLAQGLFSNNSIDKLLDVTATPIKKNILQGEQISFVVELINQGENGEVDVNLDYVIRDKDSIIVDKYENTKSFDTSKEWIEKFSLDGYATGSYSLEVLASYDGKSASSSFIFNYRQDALDEVEELAPIEEPKSNPVDNTNNVDETPIDVPKEVEVPKSAKDFDDQDFFDAALSESDTSLASSYCSKISSENLKSECYYSLAQQKENSLICDSISLTDRKEDCYMNFVMLGDETLCEKVTLEENVQLCLQFKQLSKIKSLLEENNKEELNQELGINTTKPLSQEEAEAREPNLSDLGIKDVIS